jgi:hypothetical protein
MTPPDTVEILRQVNDSLRLALIRLRPDQKQTSTITPQDFSDLLSQLLRAGQCLRSQPTNSQAAAGEAQANETQANDAAAIELESLDYRHNLEKLQQFLPDLHARLLAEKARIETAQTHVAAAAAWARASKKTL